MKIWLDTDIGSDIDDALALAYLLSHPDCELLGISTVTERKNNRAKLASAMCYLAKKTHVPIFPGAQNALLISQPQTKVQHKDALQNWPHSSNFPMQNAVLAMREAIMENPGEVTLFGIGPMTNLGALFALEPEIGSQIKEIVVMIGAYHAPAWDSVHEWNATNDPHAAALLFHAKGVKVRAIGLDVTTKVIMERAEFEAKIGASKLGPFILDIAGTWFKHQPRVTFHDPLAAATIFEKSLCKYERGEVEIELTSERLAGFTHWKAQNDGRHEIAVKVDAPRFFEEFFRVVCAS